jgi:FHA domain
VAAARYLDDFAGELRKVGERTFRRRYAVPVLIVTGRATASKRRAPPTAVRTAAERPDLIRALIGRVFLLVKPPDSSVGPVLVGRADDNEVDVVIPDHSISKRHCAFAAHEDGATIVDCGSTNGTLVNGTPIARAAMVRLVGGETITLGRLQTTFETPAAFLELVSGMVSA